MNSSQMI